MNVLKLVARQRLRIDYYIIFGLLWDVREKEKEYKPLVERSICNDRIS